MIQPRLFLFDPNLKTVSGHYLSYATLVGQGAASFGARTFIVGNRQARVGSADIPILPALPLDYWQEMRPRRADPHDHLAHTSNVFSCTVASLLEEHKVGAHDAIFLPYVNLAETLGLAKAARRLGAHFPRAALLFRRDLEEQAEDTATSTRVCAGLLRQALADLIACPGGSRVRLFTDSDNLSDDYAEATRRRFQTAPIPVDPCFASVLREEIGAPITMVYLGQARREKGYHNLPQVAQELLPELRAGKARLVLQSDFNCDGGEPGIAAAKASLAATPNVVLLEEPLAQNSYVDWLGQADAILLPYDAARYAARSSGILAEAIHAGVPTIAPQPSWMSEQLRRHGAGALYSATDPDGLRKASRRAFAAILELKAKALERREAFVQFHNPIRLAQFVCGKEVMDLGAKWLEANPVKAPVAATAVRTGPSNPRSRAERKVALWRKDHIQRLESMLPIILVTPPKCGTQLTQHFFLALLGEEYIPHQQSDLEFRDNGHDLKPVLYYGHFLFPGNDKAPKLSRIPKIFQVRDPRDYVVSYRDQILRLKNHPTEWMRHRLEPLSVEDQINAVIDGMNEGKSWLNDVGAMFRSRHLDWLGQPASHALKYEDLIGNNALYAMTDALKAIGLDFIDDEIVSLCLNIGTEIKGPTYNLGFSRWRRIFKPGNVERFNVRAPGLLRALGYPEE